jgi:tetratricopeptide (TPR) repeat protein
VGLAKCKECGNQVSTKADKCPNCGAPIKKKTRIGCIGSIIIIIFVLILIGKVSNFFEERSKEQERLEKARIEAQLEKERKEKERIASEKEKKNQKKFLEAIEGHYQKVFKLYKAKKYEEAAKELDPFINYGKLDYKDVETIYKEVRIDELEKKVRKIPVSKVSENLKIYKDLLDLDPTNPRYKKKVVYYNTKYKEKRREEERQRLKAKSDLELLNCHWSSEHGYVTAEGQVKNISGRKLERVEALVTWYDKNGNMITSDSSLIEYNPILPGQTSPFKVMERYNPAMQTANIEFKFMWGNRIPTYYQKR